MMQEQQLAAYTTETVVDWRDVLLVLHRRWLVVLLAVLVCAAAAAGVSAFVLPPVYQAEAVIRVRDAADLKGQQRPAGNMPQTAEPRSMAEHARLMTAVPLLRKVAEDAKTGPLSVEDLQGMVRVRPVRDTNMLTITVRAGSARQAAEVANRLASEYAAALAAQDRSREDAYMKALRRQAEDVSRRIAGLRSGKAAAEGEGATGPTPASAAAAAGGLPGQAAEADFRESESYYQARMDDWRRARQLVMDKQAEISALKAQADSLLARGVAADNPAVLDLQSRMAARKAELATHLAGVARLEEEVAGLVQERTARQNREEEAKTLSALYLELMRQVSALELARQVRADRPPVEVISPAITPSRPVSPDPLRNGAAAAVLSLAVALTAVFLADGAARRRREREAVGRPAG